MSNRKRWWEQSWDVPEVGQVYRMPSGTLRVVRAVHHRENTNPNKIWIYFAIRHCSWTGRCYTLYSLAELTRMGWVKIPARITRFGKFDQKLNEVCDKGMDKNVMRCCDVRGIA